MNIRKRLHKGIVYAFILFGSSMLFQMPVRADLLKFMAFADEPKDNTYLTVYPEIQDLFESDGTLVLIVEPDGSHKQKYLVNAQIQNSNGKTVYNEQKDLELKLNKGKAYLHYLIVLDDEIKSKLSPGSIIIKLYLDGKPCQAKRLQYNKQSILKKNIDKVIILPFYSSTNQIFDPKSKDEILATFSDIVRAEMQRVSPEVITPEMAGPKLSNLKIKECLEHATCQNKLINIFAEGAFVAGDVKIPKLNPSSHEEENEASLTLFLFNSRTKESVTFTSSLTMKATDTELGVMRALIQDIFTKKGFLFQVRSLM